MAECSVQTLKTPAIALVMARKGQSGAASNAAAQGFGIALPREPRIAYAEDAAILWCGPERWLVLTPEERANAAGGIEALLQPLFADAASVADQSGSRELLEISGRGARELLSRALPIDMHPRVFGPGHTAVCRAHYVPLQVWQVSVDERFVLALPRSYARDFRNGLDEALRSLRAG